MSRPFALGLSFQEEFTPLFTAIQSGQAAVVEVLLKKRVNVNAADKVVFYVDPPPPAPPPCPWTLFRRIRRSLDMILLNGWRQLGVNTLTYPLFAG